jgi:hypothetical protein
MSTPDSPSAAPSNHYAQDMDAVLDAAREVLRLEKESWMDPQSLHAATLAARSRLVEAVRQASLSFSAAPSNPEPSKEASEVVLAISNIEGEGTEEEMLEAWAREIDHGFAALRAELRECRHKADQYDSVVQAVHASDGGRYRADTIGSLLNRIRATDALREALQELRDHQNGPPLPSYEAGWQRAMQLADAALSAARSGSNGGGQP